MLQRPCANHQPTIPLGVVNQRLAPGLGGRYGPMDLGPSG